MHKAPKHRPTWPLRLGRANHCEYIAQPLQYIRLSQPNQRWSQDVGPRVWSGQAVWLSAAERQPSRGGLCDPGEACSYTDQKDGDTATILYSELNFSAVGNKILESTWQNPVLPPAQGSRRYAAKHWAMIFQVPSPNGPSEGFHQAATMSVDYVLFKDWSLEGTGPQRWMQCLFVSEPWIRFSIGSLPPSLLYNIIF